MAEQSISEVSTDERVRAVFRRAGWIAAGVAALLGLFGLLFPKATLTLVALLAGIYLIVSGIMRLSTAITSRGVAATWRWTLGLIGILLLVGGVLALNNPFGTLVALALVIGIGWIADGIGYLVAAFTLRKGAVGWALALAGLLLLISGILVLVVPATAIASLFLLMSTLLLVVGVVSLAALTLSRARVNGRKAPAA